MEQPFFPALPHWFWYPIVFAYGAIVGSFLNVLIYRLPLMEPGDGFLERINGKSYCPNCGNYLKWWHNIPLVGFLVLGGRCGFRDCRVPISWRYFAVELLNACLWTALFHQVGRETAVSWLDFVMQALFCSTLIAMIFIDLDHFIAPDELNIVGFVLGIGRDLLCLGAAFTLNRWTLEDARATYTYFGWLPRAIPGALVYGGVLTLVLLAGFLYYSKGQRESVGSAVRRALITFEDLPDALKTDEERQAEAEAIAEMEAEEASGIAPPRLRFSPGFVAFLAACLLLTLLSPTGIQWGFKSQWAYLWAGLAFFVPLVCFILLTRAQGETFGGAVRRFFSSEDLRGPEDAKLAAKAQQEADLAQTAQTPLSAEDEANQFAREAQTGMHGGMGFGDVKLALAVGAMLGPGRALLSLLIATFLGAVVGVAFSRLHGARNLRVGVPFVPFMAAGAIMSLLFGPQIIDWYLVTSGLRKPEAVATPFTPRRLRPDRGQVAPPPASLADPTMPFQRQ